ncbi:MAG: Gfo/Idh/MocA family oxidoreductase [Planctomycetes bacterium]|nr:Gfo/Idh/MocA family oxidoreductase [Planctomycetota bacterium]
MSSTPPTPDRRTFLQGSSAVLAAGSLTRGASGVRTDDLLRVALIGCGGRGTGAAMQALSTAGPVHLVAMADAFRDRLDGALAEILKEHPTQVDVPESRRFVGFDAYQKAIDLDVDVVILTTPPGFRPLHFAYAVKKGRHVFMEKPVAVDAPGIRSVLASAAEAKQKDLKVGVGLQRHHDPAYQETVARLRAGAIGKILFYRCYWNSSGVWTHAREAGWNEMTYQMRNWYYFNWLCGDHIVEQHIHNLDVCNWIQGAPPVSAQGQGGRMVRTGPDTGEIFDHHVVEFTYADGTKMLSQCRHIGGCWDSVSEHAHGTLGYADVSGGKIQSAGGWDWRHRGEAQDPYQLEHDALFAAIRAGTPYNEAEYGATSTMTAIFGRMATYSGRVLGWDEALASNLSLAPERYAWDALPRVLPDAHGVYPHAIPGVTPVI